MNLPLRFLKKPLLAAVSKIDLIGAFKTTRDVILTFLEFPFFFFIVMIRLSCFQLPLILVPKKKIKFLLKWVMAVLSEFKVSFNSEFKKDLILLQISTVSLREPITPTTKSSTYRT